MHYKRNPIPERIVHGTIIETIWIIYPSINFMYIIILLHSMNEVADSTITITVVGHQWYWSVFFYENDENATKCTGHVLWSAKLLAY